MYVHFCRHMVISISAFFELLLRDQEQARPAYHVGDWFRISSHKIK